jgi:hypothetical protein
MELPDFEKMEQLDTLRQEVLNRNKPLTEAFVEACSIEGDTQQASKWFNDVQTELFESIMAFNNAEA